MASENTPIEPKEFECYIHRASNESKKIEASSAKYGDGVFSVIKAASFELMTNGPFPYEQLHELVGRRVRVTILD